MNVEEEILDRPEVSDQKKPTLKSRVPSNLLIVFGLLYLCVGLYSLYLFFDLLGLALYEEEGFGLVFNWEIFLEVIIYRQFSFLFGLVLVLGGIGLIRHKIRGWKYALGTSVFGIIFPLLKLILTLFVPGLYWDLSSLFEVLLLLLFLASFVFLLSKTIRRFFNPKTLDYGIAGIIMLVLSVDFFVLLFI